MIAPVRGALLHISTLRESYHAARCRFTLMGGDCRLEYFRMFYFFWISTNVTTVPFNCMKLVGLFLMITLLVAGCTAKAAGNRTDLDAFDQALATFQKHLETCPYPAAHTMEFARSWNVPEFVIQAYMPKGVVFNKGKTTTD
jgi:hypothetical protein